MIRKSYIRVYVIDLVPFNDNKLQELASENGTITIPVLE